MCGGLCDAVLERTGSASILEQLERENLFLVPLDRRRHWYRYHGAFRAVLAAELELREPHLARELNCRASDWCDANGMPDAAIDYADAGNDPTRIARLVSDLALALHRRGRVGSVGVCFDRFDDDRLAERDPADHCARGLVAHPRWTIARGRSLDRCRGARPVARERCPSGMRSWLRGSQCCARSRVETASIACDRMQRRPLTQLPPDEPLAFSRPPRPGMAQLLAGDKRLPIPAWSMPPTRKRSQGRRTSARSHSPSAHCWR